MNKLPQEHPHRYKLFNEAHARPYVDVQIPARVSFIILLTQDVDVSEETNHLAKLAEHFASTAPQPDSKYYLQNFGKFSLKWERHTEFSSYTFYTEPEGDIFTEHAIHHAPQDWVSDIHGELLAAQHIELVESEQLSVSLDLLLKHFQEDSLVGNHVGGTAAKAWTDFRLQKDGFSQLLISNEALNNHTTSRLIQHFIELESYRMMAMLGFPLVETYGPEITQMGEKLKKLTHSMNQSSTLNEDRNLLEELTALEADIERIVVSTSYRFSATKAYQSIVNDRLECLRETRIEGRQTISQYLERRFEPAMNACDSISSRLESLSVRVARASQVLLARVHLALESQNQELLDSLNKTSKRQIRLQETVEGLSIAAISYYIVGLVSYLLKALKSSGVSLNESILTGLSIPVVVFSVWYGVRKVKNKILSPEK